MSLENAVRATATTTVTASRIAHIPAPRQVATATQRLISASNDKSTVAVRGRMAEQSEIDEILACITNGTVVRYSQETPHPSTGAIGTHMLSEFRDPFNGGLRYAVSRETTDRSWYRIFDFDTYAAAAEEYERVVQKAIAYGQFFSRTDV